MLLLKYSSILFIHRENIFVRYHFILKTKIRNEGGRGERYINLGILVQKSLKASLYVKNMN